MGESEIAMLKQVDKAVVKAFCEKAIAAGRMVDGRYTVQTVLKRFGFVDGDHLGVYAEYN